MLASSAVPSCCAKPLPEKQKEPRPLAAATMMLRNATSALPVRPASGHDCARARHFNTDALEFLDSRVCSADSTCAAA